MANTATITAKTMGGLTVTAKVYTGVISFFLDTVAQMLFITVANDTRYEFDVSGATTYTLTYSSGSYTLTVS